MVEASFSHDGVYAVTGDLDGLIQVWQVATKALVWCENIGLATVWKVDILLLIIWNEVTFG